MKNPIAPPKVVSVVPTYDGNHKRWLVEFAGRKYLVDKVTRTTRTGDIHPQKVTWGVRLRSGKFDRSGTEILITMATGPGMDSIIREVENHNG